MSLKQKGELPKPEVKPEPCIFDIKAMNVVVSEIVEPLKMMVGNLIYANELTILFGKSNTGKSLKAISIANAISKGESLNMGSNIILVNECEPTKVLFFDFEMSQQQIQKRYDKDMPFENFDRATLKDDQYTSDDPKEMANQLRTAIKYSEAKCIIIDNVSAISSDLEKSNNAIKFMQELKRMAKRESITVIVIAHTPKLKDFVPLNLESLAGSSKLNQLSDGILGIGKVNSDADNEYYIIDLKSRNDAKSYHRGNVIHTKIEKVNGTLQHVAIGTAKEQDLLDGDIFENTTRNHLKFYTSAYLYYGSKRNAETAIKEPLAKVGVNANNSTIMDNANAYKKMHPEGYKDLEKLCDDELYNLMNLESPYQDEYLPQKKNHKTSEAPF